MRVSGYVEGVKVSLSYLKGVLLDYGPVLHQNFRNMVTFQSNPESLTRTIFDPGHWVSSTNENDSTLHHQVTERIAFTLFFDAAEALNDGDSNTKQYGIGHKLAALEQMKHPINFENAEVSLDGIGNVSSISLGKLKKIVRPERPKILFIWGRMRTLPVIFESLTIVEQQFDEQLNPIKAKVDLVLDVFSVESLKDDDFGREALEYSNRMKAAQIIANLENIMAIDLDHIFNDQIEKIVSYCKLPKEQKKMLKVLLKSAEKTNV